VAKLKAYISKVWTRLKKITRDLWQIFLDLPIFTKITMMLMFCVTGYIIIGVYYVTVIKSISHDLDRIKTIQTCMFNVSQTLVSHIDVIRHDIKLFSAEKSSPVEREMAIKNANAHFERLCELITAIQNGHTGGCCEVPDLPTRPLSNLSSALTVSLKNALDNVNTHLKFIREYNTKETDDNDTEHTLILQHVAELEYNLHNIEQLSSNILETTTSYIQKTVETINNRTEWNSKIGILIISLVMLVLIAASYTWASLLVGPLRLMASSLESIKSSAMSNGSCQCVDKIPVIGKDEIGQVAEATNKLLLHMKNIFHFRRTIESDETASEVYRRLGQVFNRQIGLKIFVIYETRKSDEKMLPVYVEPPELESQLKEVDITCDKCRASRTGSFITSFQDEGICPIFSWPDALTHACIPMNVGGETLGVIQFLFPYVNNREREEAFKNAVMEAKFYLMEAMPVIKAKLLAQTLTENATKDPLTGLFNRRYLEMHLNSIVAQSKRMETTLGILMCDLDYFKQVNDQYGHDTGDMVLMQLAKLIKQQARESDLTIRFGGEEFLVLLVNCESGLAEKVAERIRKTVEEYQFHFPGGKFNKTISIGISEFPNDTDIIWEAIKFADVALYNAKEKGRNRIVRFTPEMWGMENF